MIRARRTSRWPCWGCAFALRADVGVHVADEPGGDLARRRRLDVASADRNLDGRCAVCSHDGDGEDDLAFVLAYGAQVERRLPACRQRVVGVQVFGECDLISSTFPRLRKQNEAKSSLNAASIDSSAGMRGNPRSACIHVRRFAPARRAGRSRFGVGVVLLAFVHVLDALFPISLVSCLLISFARPGEPSGFNYTSRGFQALRKCLAGMSRLGRIVRYYGRYSNFKEASWRWITN